MNKWFFAIPISALLILGMFLAVNKPTETIELENSEQSLAGAKVNIDTWFGIQFKPAGEEWTDTEWNHNTFMDVGRDHLEGLLNGTITSNEHTRYLALGNGTAPTTGSTTLNSEQTLCGLPRVLGDPYHLGTGWWEVNTTYTYTCDVSLKVNMTAAFNEASGGTMFAGGTITDVIFTTNGDQLRLRHNNSISEA